MRQAARALPASLFFLCCVSAAPVALAQSYGDKGAPGDTGARDAALRTAAAAQQLYQAESYAEALDQFRRAYLLYPSPDLQVYIAACLASLHVEIDELRALIEFFADPGASKPALRSLALRLWQESSPSARQDLLGPGGDRLPAALRRKLSVLPPWHRQQLPAELRAVKPLDVEPAKVAPVRVEPAVRPPRLWPGLTLAGAGLAAIAAGTALVVIDGGCAPSGDINRCPRVYQTAAGGYTTLALGAAALGAGAIWFVYSALHHPRFRSGLRHPAAPASAPATGRGVSWGPSSPGPGGGLMLGLRY